MEVSEESSDDDTTILLDCVMSFVIRFRNLQNGKLLVN